MTITDERFQSQRSLSHPGEILLEEFFKPVEITPHRVAKEVGVSQRRIGEIVTGKRAVTAATGLGFFRFFGLSEDFWIGLQPDYDAAHAKDALADVLERTRPSTNDVA